MSLNSSTEALTHLFHVFYKEQAEGVLCMANAFFFFFKTEKFAFNKNIDKL